MPLSLEGPGNSGPASASRVCSLERRARPGLGTEDSSLYLELLIELPRILNFQEVTNVLRQSSVSRELYSALSWAHDSDLRSVCTLGSRK